MESIVILNLIAQLNNLKMRPFSAQMTPAIKMKEDSSIQFVLISISYNYNYSYQFESVNAYLFHFPGFVIFRPYLNKEGESSTQNERFFMITCQLIMSANADSSEVDFLKSPNYGTFAVECD